MYNIFINKHIIKCHLPASKSPITESIRLFRHVLRETCKGGFCSLMHHALKYIDKFARSNAPDRTTEPM